MAPEIKNLDDASKETGRPYGIEADVWSIGVIALHAARLSRHSHEC